MKVVETRFCTEGIYLASAGLRTVDDNKDSEHHRSVLHCEKPLSPSSRVDLKWTNTGVFYVRARPSCDLTTIGQILPYAKLMTDSALVHVRRDGDRTDIDKVVIRSRTGHLSNGDIRVCGRIEQ